MRPRWAQGQFAFPDPATAATEGARVRLLPLAKLMELKLASGMSAAHRLRDLADVLEIIRLERLPEEFGAQLSNSVGYCSLLRSSAAERPEIGPLSCE